MTASIELLFKLDCDDEWPPAAVEGIWGQPEGSWFRALTCPLFVKGLSVGDVIAPELDNQGEVTAFKVIQPSQNSTVWVIAQDPNVRENLLAAVRALGCNTVGGLHTTPSLCSIDVPANVTIDEIDSILGSLEREEKISIAYPSFRHPDR